MVTRTLRALLGALLLVSLTLVAAPGRAETRTVRVKVDIESVSTPVIDRAKPHQSIQIRGTLTNTSTSPLKAVTAHFWRVREPMRTPERLAVLPKAEDATIPGRRLGEDARGNKQSLTAGTQSIAPAESVPFSVSATVGQLQLPEDNAGYILGVQIVGAQADGTPVTLGGARVVVAATSAPIATSAVVMLTAAPSWLPGGTFIDTSLANELGGRLERLLTSAERSGTVAAIDPALYEAVGRMRETHTVGQAQMRANPAAGHWLDRVDALGREGRLYRLPYGNPDLARAEASGQLPHVLAWARRALPKELAGLPGLVVDTGLSRQSAASLDDFSTVICLEARGADNGSPRIVGGTRVAADMEQARLGLRMAESVVSKRPRVALIDTADAVDADAALASRQRYVPLGSVPSGGLHAAETKKPRAWREVRDLLDTERGKAALYTTLTGRDVAAMPRLGATAYNAAFDDQTEAVAYVDAARPTSTDPARVTVSAAQSFVMGSRTNAFPATITNGLDRTITVRLHFTSDSPQRIRVPSIGPVRIRPGDSQTLDVKPEATANGVTLVHAQITSADGRPIGQPVTVEITSTDFGRVGWLIILVSGAVVLLGTAMRIRKVRRQRVAAQPADEDSDRPEEDREPGQ